MTVMVRADAICYSLWSCRILFSMQPAGCSGWDTVRGRQIPALVPCSFSQKKAILISLPAGHSERGWGGCLCLLQPHHSFSGLIHDPTKDIQDIELLIFLTLGNNLSQSSPIAFYKSIHRVRVIPQKRRPLQYSCQSTRKYHKNVNFAACSI